MSGNIKKARLQDEDMPDDTTKRRISIQRPTKRHVMHQHKKENRHHLKGSLDLIATFYVKENTHIVPDKERSGEALVFRRTALFSDILTLKFSASVRLFMHIMLATLIDAVYVLFHSEDIKG